MAKVNGINAVVLQIEENADFTLKSYTNTLITLKAKLILLAERRLYMALRRKELLNEIAALEKEQNELESAIKRIDNKENFETVKHFTYLYRKSIYRKIPFSYLDTVFYSHKSLLQKHANGCFIEKILDVACDAAKSRNLNELVMDIPMFCNNTLKTDNGIIFILSDPYRTIATKPMIRITDDTAKSCMGRIIVAKLVIPENHRAVTSFEMKAYKPLKMSLNNIFGKDPPIIDPLFTQFKDINTEEDAIKALDTIEEHYLFTGDSMTLRQNIKSLRILTDTKLIGISYEKEKLWYADENSKSLFVLNSIKDLPDKEKHYSPRTGFTFEDELLFPV